ncbi:MAG: hypothetical protein JW863_05625 [Chitinispirillaceae bacterium]|nr:hypothetical protein [Chitinispirillaceae bacterium]
MEEKKYDFSIHSKLSNLLKGIVPDIDSSDIMSALPGRLSEIHNYCFKVSSLIDDLCKYDNSRLGKNEYDKLLGDLVDLKVHIYDELFDWIKESEMPLQKMIDEVEKKLNAFD